MKTLLKISVILFLLTSVIANSQTFNQIEAYTDENCNNISAGFTIPKRLIAFNFDFKIIPQWSTCNSMSSTEYNMVGIRAKNKSIYLYQSYIYRNGEIKESSDLSNFILGPGDYQLVISSNKGNSVILKYYTGKEIALVLP